MVRKKPGIIESAMRNHNIVVIITVLLMVMGVVALIKMPRNEFPPITVRMGVVVGVYPGASSAEVEAQLTKVVENYIFGFQEVDKAKTYTQSQEGIMYMFVELKGDVKNPEQFWAKLKHGLIELKMTLPNGVLALVANSDFGDTSAFLITLSSDTKSYKELEDQLEKLEAEIRKNPSVSKIKRFGLQNEKIYVNVKPEKLNEYNIKTLSLLGAYQLNGMVNYAGELKDGKNNRAVHFPANFETEKDLAEQIVYSDPNGNVVRLKDIATIERRYEDPDSYIKQNGMKTILLSLEMQPGNNIVEFGNEIDKTLSSFEKQCPEDIKVAKISELPKYVQESISNFMQEFLIAIIAVILVIVLLLPFKVSSVAAVTIPISVLITLTFSYIAGLELNTVTLASLILVLGMIVDNSIVIIDNYIEKLDNGFSNWNAAIKSAKELATPVITATLAILAVFFPLSYFMKGTAGEFVAPFPIVIGISLTVSVLVAIFLVPYLNYVFIKKGLKKKDTENTKKSFLNYLQKWYDKSLEKAFHHPRKVIAAGSIIVIGGLAILPTLDIQLFPELERNQMAMEVYLPTGTSLESTAEVLDSMESILLKDKRVTNVTSFIGTSSPRFHTVYAPNMPAPNYGQILLNTTSNEATRDIAKEYSKKYNNYFVNAHIKCKILALQKNKSGIEIRITSDSIKDIRTVETQINAILDSTQYVTWVRNDWGDRKQNIRVNLERDKANRLGYSKALVATSVMTGLNGLPLTTVWEDDYPIGVVLSQESCSKKDIQTLGDQYITSPYSFSAIPLRSFASLTPEWTEGAIVHRNGVRTLTISADNDMDVMTQSVFSKIKSQVDGLKLPEGTSISYGGEWETAAEEFPPVFISLGVSIIIIFFILLFVFKKSKIAILIMTTMILGIPGAFIGIKLMGFPASLTGLMGITSLCGLVVRNGIILIDYARELKEKDRTMTAKEAALAAGKRRMRPIFLTSAAASVGVIPMIMGGSLLWGPLGSVICFGLIVSMILTLYILPILYAWVMKDRPKKRSIWSVPVRRATIVLLLVSSVLLPNAKAQIVSLDSCKKMALANNYQIKQAASEVEASEQLKKSAFTNYFPKVSAGATSVKFDDYLIKTTIPEMNLPVYDGNPANLATATQYAYFPSTSINAFDYMNIASVIVAQPIYAGGRIMNGNKLAGTGYEIYKEKQEMTTIEVLVKTEELYWTVISLNEKIKTLSSYIQMLDTLQRDVNNAFNAGLVQRSDLLKVQLKISELQVNKMKLTNGITLSKMALCQHTGLPFDSVMVLDSTMNIDNPLVLAMNSKEAVENRSEYKMLEKAVSVEELQKKIVVGEYLPQVSVGAAGIYTDLMNNSNTNGLVFATVSIPISDWWGGAHKIKQSKATIAGAQYKLTETSELLNLQITQAMNSLKEDYFQIETAQKSIEQAQENLKVIDNNYKAGISGMSDLLEAQSAYQAAKDNYTEAQCNYQIKKAKYLQVTGRYQ